MTCTTVPLVCVADHDDRVSCPGCYDGCTCRLTDACRMDDDVCTVHGIPEYEHPPRKGRT